MRTNLFVSALIVTILFVSGVTCEAGHKTYRLHSNGRYYRTDAYDGIWYVRDIYGNFVAISVPSTLNSRPSTYSGREGLERLATRMAEDALWLQSFEKIVSKLPDNLGSQLYRRGLNDVLGGYGVSGGNPALSGYSYSASSRYGYTGQGVPQGYTQGVAGGYPAVVDSLTTIKELTSYATRLAEQSHKLGSAALGQAQANIDGAVMGLVNAERIRAAGDVAVAAVEAASQQERATESRYEYTSQHSRVVGDAPSSAPGGEWMQVLAARCISCHSPEEMGGKGQMPLLHGDIGPELRAKIFEAVVSKKMPRNADGEYTPLGAEEFQTLVTGVRE